MFMPDHGVISPRPTIKALADVQSSYFPHPPSLSTPTYFLLVDLRRHQRSTQILPFDSLRNRESRYYNDLYRSRGYLFDYPRLHPCHSYTNFPVLAAVAGRTMIVMTLTSEITMGGSSLVVRMLSSVATKPVKQLVEGRMIDTKRITYVAIHYFPLINADSC